jgi:hypothetical protein
VSKYLPLTEKDRDLMNRIVGKFGGDMTQQRGKKGRERDTYGSFLPRNAFVKSSIR